MLDNLPRLRLSDSQMSAILYVMKELGAPVPSLSSLRREQWRLREMVAVPTERYRSGHGNVFYVNNVLAQVVQVHVCPYLLEFNT